MQKLILCWCLVLAACGGGDVDTIAQCRKASDMAASCVFPASMVSATYQQGSAAGEPYLIKCTAQANRIYLYLHSWSGDMNQVLTFPELGALDRACVIAPNFNGPNTTAQAMGSDDSLARIDTVVKEVMYKTGLSRIYLVGHSGGSMAAMNYLGKYPGKVHLASLWLPIWDLASLYATTQDQQLKDNMLAVIGHAPAHDNDPDYLARSPRARLVGAYGPTTVYLNVGATDISSPPAQAQGARDQLQAQGFGVVYKEWPMGHQFDQPQRYEAIKQLILE